MKRLSFLLVLLFIAGCVSPGEKAFLESQQSGRKSAGLTEKYIDVGKFNICYMEGGKGETVLLVHGFTGWKEFWAAFAKYLVPKYHVVAIDLPGHGKIDGRIGSPGMDHFGPEVVPAGCLFVLGDNRDNSTDSRSWGYVHRDQVLGKALVVYWSWSPDTTRGFWRRIRWDRIGERIL